MTITKSKCVSFSFSSRPTDPTLLLIFSLQQEINLEWPNLPWPTGSGKSLCYCLLPLAFDFLRRKKREEEENPDPDTCTASPKSIVLVVSPLIALMKNQVKAMQERNVSSLYAGDMDEKARHEVCSGKYQLIFISPESLTSSDWWRDVLLSPVYQDNLVGFVIDEAHLVKQW